MFAVITSLSEWRIFLDNSGLAASFPLLIGGVGLMIFGWRMWRFCVVLSFALIGAILVGIFVPPSNDQWMYALAAAAVLGLASYWPANYAVGLLGGLIGSGGTVAYLYSCRVDGPVLWFIGAAAGLAAMGYAFINLRHIVVYITSFLGAVLLISGLASLLMQSPELFGAYRSAASYSALVLPFILIVPTVMGSFYQISEMRRLHFEF